MSKLLDILIYIWQVFEFKTIHENKTDQKEALTMPHEACTSCQK